ncbi:MAG: hypothetical protein AB7G47_21315 [Mycolicibacterium sp.]|uniref:hypothetical protein n=1 Tax=Mycolicibacterium sp. TaxID=2320850 RepID=UPI003D150EF0
MKLIVLALAVLGALMAAPVASAQPYPGCPFKIPITYNVCSERPGVPGFTPGFTLTEGVPGIRGPDGLYTPILDHRAPHDEGAL